MKETAKKLGRYLLGRLREPTTWASVLGLVAVYKPQLAHELAAVAGVLGIGLAEGTTQ